MTHGARYCPGCNRYFANWESNCAGCGGSTIPDPMLPLSAVSSGAGGRSLTGCMLSAKPTPAPMLRAPMGSVPDRVDLRPYCSPVEDQGQTNSCTANAMVGALEYHQKRGRGGGGDLSRLYVYYNARRMSEKTGEDCGSFIHHVVAAVIAHGACEENVWPFDAANVKAPPPQRAYEAAGKNDPVQYARVTLDKTAVPAVAAGLPIVFGTFIPQRFYEEAGKTGVMPMPAEQAEAGAMGHAMLIVGYDLPAKQWIVRNSWGAKWADQGYFRVPFETMAAYSYAEDFWAVGQLEQLQGFGTSGPSMMDIVKTTVANAAREVQEAIDAFIKKHASAKSTTAAGGAQPRGYSGPAIPVSQRPMQGCLLSGSPASAPLLRAPMGSIPDKMDLRPYCSPVEDQGQTNSCTANAIVGALEYHQRKSGRASVDLSRLFVYYNARKLADTQFEDCGSHIHHVMASVLAFGACEERIWPFDPLTVTFQPGQDAYQDGMKHEAVQYARAPLGQSAMQAVGAGLPVVFGAFIPQAYFQEAEKTGLMPMPKEQRFEQAGGHAMLLVGYDQTARQWIVRNSWGTKFGDNGYFRMPFETLNTFANPEHFWTVGAIEGAQGMSMSGPSMAEFGRTTQANAAAEAKAALDSLRKDLRKDLSDDAAAAKKSIRDRLRGPGS